MRKLLSFAAVLLAGSLYAQPTDFAPRGPGGGGAMFASSFNPANAQELFVQCDMKQVFHSTDLGASWTIPNFTEFQSYKISAISYTSNGTVLYGVDGPTLADGSDVSRPTKSTDGGVTWTPLASDPTSGGAYMVYAHPGNAQIVLVSDYNTLYGSTNGGTSFTQKYHTNNNNAGLHIAGAFFDGANIYIGTNEGLLLSVDGGVTFSKPTLAGIGSGESIVSFAGAKQGATTRFFCVTNSSVYAGITGADHYSYKAVYSLDLGAGAWQKKVNGIASGVHPFFCGMPVGNTNIAYVAGGGDASAPTVYKTTDGGASWSSVFKTTNNQNIKTGWSGDGGDRLWSYGEYALGFAVAPSDPNNCVITDLGFAHMTTDGGSSWYSACQVASDRNPAGAKTPIGKSYHSVGMENTTCWQVAWIDKDNLYGCYSDIKGTRSIDGGASWGFNFTGHNDNSMYYLLKNTSNNTVYAATSTVHDMYQSTTLTDARIDGGKGKVLFSNDKGANWTTLHDFAHPVFWLATDVANPTRMYAAVLHSTLGGIYVSNDIDKGAASQWTKLANPPRTEGHPCCIRVLNDGTIVAAYSGRRTTNFTASSGVFVSTDNGASWMDRSDANMQYWTKDVVIDPSDATQNTWYAGVFSGWGGAANNKGGLYKTTNRGQSWTKISSEQRVTSCTISPTNADIMYFTTETDGLFYSSNRRAANPTFTQVASYPFRQPERVFFNPHDTSEVWVTSFGNGMRVGKTSAVGAVPDKVVLHFPSNGTPNSAIPRILQWDVAKNAITYHVQVSKDSLFATSIFDSSNIAINTTTINKLDSDQVYYWRANATNNLGTSAWSDVWSFSTTAKVPLLILPLKSAVDLISPVTYQWHGSKIAESYVIGRSKSSDFTQTFIIYNVTDTIYIDTTDLSGNTTYFWHVASLKHSSQGAWSDAWSFTTKALPGVPPTKPILISPEDKSGTYFFNVDLQWHSVQTANVYHVIVAKDSLFSDIFLSDSTVIDSSLSLFKNLRGDTSYWWKVRGKNESSWGPWSNEWSFHTIGERSVKEEAINLPLFNISPNPSTGDIHLHIKQTKPEAVVIHIVGIDGKLLRSFAYDNKDAAESNITLSCTDLATGTYYVILQGEKTRGSQKIVIFH